VPDRGDTTVVSSLGPCTDPIREPSSVTPVSFFHRLVRFLFSTCERLPVRATEVAVQKPPARAAGAPRAQHTAIFPYAVSSIHTLCCIQHSYMTFYAKLGNGASRQQVFNIVCISISKGPSTNCCCLLHVF